MKNGRLKNSISYILLVLVLSMKMMGLHGLSHTDDQNHAIHCTICDRVIAHDLTPVLLPEIPLVPIENSEFKGQNEITKRYSFLVSKRITTNHLVTRPPPVFV